MLHNERCLDLARPAGYFEPPFTTLCGANEKLWVVVGMLEMKNGLDQLRARNCISLEYVDSTGQATEEYPENPNGSPGGIAGICSLNGRHLAMMPHPERTVLTWQWPWIPENLSWPKNAVLSPWMKMFSNAYNWCGA